MLAILPMLARKGALCVGPGGSAPLFPSPGTPGKALPGRDGKAGASIEPESGIDGGEA